MARSATDFESAWKLARARYWLGTNGPGPGDERKRVLEQGIAAGRVAMAARPVAAEGHFWMAANMGAATALTLTSPSTRTTSVAGTSSLR